MPRHVKCDRGEKPRDPDSEALIGELVRLTGTDGFDQSDREIEAEMAALDVKVSHERIRQYRNDEWEIVIPATRRKIRIYLDWKNARRSVRDGVMLADAAEAAVEHRGRKEKSGTS